jgi:hypothetical protein
MVFHVRISTAKMNWWDTDIVILDLDREQLIKNVVEPYHRGKSISYNKNKIDSNKIISIKINETKEDSSVLIPTIQQRRNVEKHANSGKKRSVVDLTPDEIYVTEEGKDVTNDFIKHKPQNYVKDSKTKLKKMTKFQKGILGIITTIITAVIIADLANCIFIPISNQPSLSRVNSYDNGKKFFPDELNFYPDSNTNSYITTMAFYFVKVGGNPAIFYLILYNASGMLSRHYDGTYFKNISEDTEWFINDEPGSLRIVLQENPHLSNFTLFIEYGTIYPIYPVFGLHSIPINLVTSERQWCTYKKVNEHLYKYKQSSFEY